MAMANRILRVAAPQIAPPVAVREGDAPPEVRRVPPDELGAGIAEAVRELQVELGEAGIAIVSPASLVDEVTAALTDAGIAFGVATRRLAIVHADPLPEALVEPSKASTSVS